MKSPASLPKVGASSSFSLAVLPFDLWASMMSSGTPPLPLTISNLWPQCLAALQSWLTFSKKKKS